MIIELLDGRLHVRQGSEFDDSVEEKGWISGLLNHLFLILYSPLVPPLLMGIRVGHLSSLAHEVFQVLEKYRKTKCRD